MSEQKILYYEDMNSGIQKLYFTGIGALVIFIAVLNTFAYQFYWYWRFWWFDMIMHTLGGAFIGSFSLWYYFFRKKQKVIPQKLHTLAISLMSVAVVGIGWELFEFSVDTFITLSRHDPIDTASDLFFDVLGGMFAILFFFFVYNKEKNQVKI